MPPHPAHAPALGAAALGAAAASMTTAATTEDEGQPQSCNLERVIDLAPPEPHRRYAPCAELRDLYDQAYECFCQVHPALHGLFQQLRDPPSKP